MPIDRDLAIETLKRKHPDVYQLYVRLRDEGMTYHEIEEDINALQKLHLCLTTWNVLDDMERKGLVAIYNDYKSKRIVLKKLSDSKIPYGVIE